MLGKIGTVTLSDVTMPNEYRACCTTCVM